jgi:hypothetical protein
VNLEAYIVNCNNLTELLHGIHQLDFWHLT